MVKLKPQYEEFCQSYVAYPNAGEAAHAAGYGFDFRYQQGARLLRRSAIAARIRELRDEIVERECLTVGALLSKLEASFRQALRSDNAHAAVRVIELQAKIAGLVGMRTGLSDAEIEAVTADAPALPSNEATRAALQSVARSSARKRLRLKSA